MSLFLCFLSEDLVPVFAKRSKTDPDDPDFEPDPILCPDFDPDPFLGLLPGRVEVRDDFDFDPDSTEARDKDAVLTVEDENVETEPNLDFFEDAADEAILAAQLDEW